LTRALARRLVLQTIAGAARQLQIEELSPAALKDAVASPGGTTIAGLERLEFRGLRAAVMDAVAAATARSRELGSGK
jgi:pyrroline-5-carboxylate reductase